MAIVIQKNISTETSFRSKVSLIVMACLYIAAGLNHFSTPDIYYKIMPPYIPYPHEMVFISGVFEIALGLLLFIKPARKVAAWGIITLLVAVFPANIQMMLNYLHQEHSLLWLAILRLPLQLVLVWWAYTFTKLN